MEYLSSLNNFDYILLAIIGISILMGIWRGFILEFVALLIWCLSFFAAIHYSVEAGHLFMRAAGNEQTAGLLGFVSVLVVLIIVGAVVTLLISAIAGGKGLAGRGIGAVFGFLRGCVISFVIVFICLHSNWRVTNWYTNSKLVPCFSQVNVWILNNVLKYKKDHWYFKIDGAENLKRNKQKMAETIDAI